MDVHDDAQITIEPLNAQTKHGVRIGRHPKFEQKMSDRIYSFYLFSGADV